MSQGRPSVRYPVESALRLDLARLNRWGWLKPGCLTSGRMTWTYPWGDARSARVTVSLPGAAITVSFDDEERAQLIPLASTVQAYGGVRWWLLCPRTRRSCRALYLPNGGRYFASRQAWRLVYRSQQMSPEDRAWHRVHRLSAAIGTCYEADEWEKPKGMHWRTFERKAHALEAAHAVVDAYFLARCERFPEMAEMIAQLK